MGKQKNRWGIAVFLLSLPVAGLAFYITFVFPPAVNPRLYATTIPVLGIILSVAAFLAGHFSYPRVHNLKVYLAGYLTGLSGLAYFGLYTRPERLAPQVTLLLLLVFANIVLVLILPGFVKYRVTRRITLSVVTAEAACLLAAAATPDMSAWTLGLVRDDLFSMPSWLGMGWMLAVAVLAVWLLRFEFYLGGILTGTAALYCLAWLSPGFITNSADFEKLMFVAAPLYLQIGILIHWFMRMEHRVSYDPLLHIYNRSYCSRIITEQSNCNTAPPFGVAMIDIDHFKKVNDTYGHQAGDTVLYNVAQAIVREVVPNGVVCRYGGEEIVVFFPRKTTKEVVPIIENVRETVGKMKVPTRKKRLSVTVSCGVSHREEASQSVMDVINTADKALYRAKKGGRNQVKSAKTAQGPSKKK